MLNASINAFKYNFLSLSKRPDFQRSSVLQTISYGPYVFDNILCHDISAKQKVEFEYQDRNWQNKLLGLLVPEQRSFETFHRDKL